jgi:hypothetical protein
VPRINLRLLFWAALGPQSAFLLAHFALVLVWPKALFLREALPLIYLTATYGQWLVVAVFISWRYHAVHTRDCRVPLVMHLPHLLSFLPLMRHVILAANRTPADTTSLSLAWVHAVSTHTFSVMAAWLWQVRRRFDAHEVDLIRREAIPLAFYGIAAITGVLLYAGLDFSFEKTGEPFAVGVIQLVLNLAVTAILLYREHGSLKVFAVVAAAVFSLANAALLFDKSPSDIGVEAALAATSFTQIFSLFVFLIFSRAKPS